LISRILGAARGEKREYNSKRHASKIVPQVPSFISVVNGKERNRMDSSSSAESSAKSEVVETRLSGYDLLLHPGLNKGTAFTEEERDSFALHGLLPPHLGTLEDQLERRMRAFENQTDSFERYNFMRDLQDSNETLFYALVTGNVEKFLPVV
jgi:malate dehydrogenase (oxaloacetate-decarboxylating)